MRYFLIGYKSSGKTTLGKKLANKLNMQFIDLDEYIEDKENKSIPELYTNLGEKKFREMEGKALNDIVEKDHLVISTGGGTPCHCDNMNIMQSKGITIYLKIAEDVLVHRLKIAASNNRPIVKGKTKEEIQKYVNDLKTKCEHHYTRADYIIEGRNLNVHDILNVIQPGAYSKE